MLVFLTGLLIFGLSHANPLSDGLEAALPHYRQLAADPAVRAAWDEPLSAIPRKLEPGKPYAGLALLSSAGPGGAKRFCPPAYCG